jgi:NAD-dependent SIR2 family protein deacetylase
MTTPPTELLLRQSAEWIRQAKCILVTAGAGMSVDSGLPDFRGPEGFWRAYPAFKKLGKKFEEMSNPEWFEKDPKVAWGFFGHRLQLYDRTIPHRGYHIIRSWQKLPTGTTQSGQTTTAATPADAPSKSMFVYTSNVDGAFEKVGFRPDQIAECHGAGTRLQCTDEGCAIKHGPWKTPADFRVDVDMETVTASPETMPHCPHCGRLARPNILMFGDMTCDIRVMDQQEEEFERWKRKAKRVCREGLGDFLVIEIGAGTYVPTIRWTSEKTTEELEGRLIRVNLRDAFFPEVFQCESLALPMTALSFAEAMEKQL